MKKHNCYKVLSPSRASAVARDELRVEYFVGKKSTAPIGGLLAFRDLKSAEDFRNDERSDLIIVKANGEKRVKLPPTAASSVVMSKAKLIWNYEDAILYTIPWPEGTVAYKEITCLE